MQRTRNLVFIALLSLITSCAAIPSDFVPYRSKAGTYTYVTKGKTSPAFEGEWDRAYLFQNGLARVKKDNLFGYINRKGKLIIPLYYEYAEDFEQGVAVVGRSEDDEYPPRGMIDTLGNLITPMLYDQFGDLSEGFRAVIIDQHAGFVDLKGTLRIPVKYRTSPEMPPYFYEGLCSVENPAEEYATTFGFIDTTGTFVLEPTYELWGGAAMHNMPIFSDGLSVFKKENKFGYMDKKGKVILPAIYDAADAFSEGLAPVRIKDQIIFIDAQGKQAFDLILGGVDEGVMGFTYDGFENGQAIVNLNREGEVNDWNSYYFSWEPGLIDTNGIILATGTSIPGLDNRYFTYIEDIGDSTSQIRCKLNGNLIEKKSSSYIRKSYLDNYLMIDDDWDWDDPEYYFIDENGFEYWEN